MTPERLKALALAEGKAPTAANIAELGRVVSPQDAAWAFTQWALRESAKVKFPNADRMLLTREALEQATSFAVARYHASRFPEGALVADLTAGIGGDLMALTERGPVVAFELDEERATYAEWNAGVSVRREDPMKVSWEWEYAFCDPSRRRAGRRLSDPQDFSPNPSEVALRMANLRLGGIKLSPLLSDAFLENLGSCIEFVSSRGECVEALIWTGMDAIPGRYAVQVTDVAIHRLDASPALPTKSDVGSFVFDCDAAAVRAHALGALCGEYNLYPLADSVGYLTGQHAVRSPWLRGYRVLAAAPAREQRVRAAARGLTARVIEVKSRVRETGRFAWVTRVAEGERCVTAMLYQSGRSVQVLLVEPLDAGR